jgi:hypothetical protein
MIVAAGHNFSGEVTGSPDKVIQHTGTKVEAEF